MVCGCGRTVVLMINRQANSVKRLSKNEWKPSQNFVHKLYSNKGKKIIGVDQGMPHWPSYS